MENYDFEEMRNQLAILKNKVDGQELLNEKLLREVVKTKTDIITRKMKVALACAIFSIVSAPICFHYSFHLSWAFVIATDLMMLYCIFLKMRYKRFLSNKTLNSEPLLDVAERMSQFKKDHKRYTFFNIFVILPLWIAWMIVEKYMQHPGEFRLFLGEISPMLVGLVIGGCIGFRMYLKIQDTASDIIRQIEE